MADDSLGPAQAADGLCRCGETTDTLIEEMIAAGVPARLVAKVAVLGERLRAADQALADERADRARQRAGSRERLRRHRERKRTDGDGIRHTSGVTVDGGIRHTSDGIRHTSDAHETLGNVVQRFETFHPQNAPQSAFDFIEQSPSRRAHAHTRAHASTRNEDSSFSEDSGIKDSKQGKMIHPKGKGCGERDVSTTAYGTRLPSDWTPGPEHFAEAAKEGMSHADAQAAAAEFRDYWIAIPGKAGRKADWMATWRNRVRMVVARQRKFTQHRDKPPRWGSKEWSREENRRGMWLLDPRNDGLTPPWIIEEEEKNGYRTVEINPRQNDERPSQDPGLTIGRLMAQTATSRS